jgi:hypothetical protein
MRSPTCAGACATRVPLLTPPSLAAGRRRRVAARPDRVLGRTIRLARGRAGAEPLAAVRRGRRRAARAFHPSARRGAEPVSARDHARLAGVGVRIRRADRAPATPPRSAATRTTRSTSSRRRCRASCSPPPASPASRHFRSPTAGPH